MPEGQAFYTQSVWNKIPDSTKKAVVTTALRHTEKPPWELEKAMLKKRRDTEN